MTTQTRSSVEALRASALGATAIVAVAVAAWLPSLQPYVPAAEDFGPMHVSELSIAAYWQWVITHIHVEGLWRVVGLPFTDILRNLHPLAFPFTVLLFHAANGILVARLLLRLGASHFFALLAALLFVTLPCAVEANLYAGASQSVQTTTAFLLLAFHLDAVIQRVDMRAWDLMCCFLFVLVGILIQENLFFAYLALPAAIAYVQRPLRSWSKSTIHSVVAYSICTLLAMGTFVAITHSLETNATKSPTLNLATLLSFPAYQITNLVPYELWGHKNILSLVLGHESLAVTAFSSALFLVGLMLAMPVFSGRTTIVDGAARSRELRLMWAAMMLWYAAGFVYVMGGGYSFESRKKYVTLIFLAMLAAYVVSRFVQTARGSHFRRGAVAISIGVIALSAATTWVISGLWVLEARRGSALVSVIAARPNISVAHVRFVPNIIGEWPRWVFLASSQHYASWVTEFEMRHRFGRNVRMVPDIHTGATVIECRYLAREGGGCEVLGPQ